jgi:hypothetical protein
VAGVGREVRLPTSGAIGAQSPPRMDIKIKDIKRFEEHSRNALAVRGDEGRGTLR